MLQSRRGCLIGAGSLLTAAFVADARSFIHRNSQPLLSSPSQVAETMYWHEIPDEGYQITLGPCSVAPLRKAAQQVVAASNVVAGEDDAVARYHGKVFPFPEAI
jgi:hypothetical protein